MNTLFTEYAKSLYDDTSQLDAKSMVKVLHILLHTSSVEEVSIKQLDRMYQLNVDDRSLFSKRFDFVDLTNRRVYEFDGDHHFKLIEHFHGTYDNFVKGRSHDILKQKFIVENGFDLVRITGNLTVHRFIDILVRLNLQVGQSVFIKDDVYQVVNTSDLLCELDVVEMLQVENARLRQKLQELEQYNFDEFDRDDIDKDPLYIFLEDEFIQLDNVKLLSTRMFYELYKKWSVFAYLEPVNKRDFLKRIEPYMLKLGYKLSDREDRHFFSDKNKSVDAMYSYMKTLVDVDNHQSRYFYKEKDFIGYQDLVDLLNRFDNIDVEQLSDNEKILLEFIASNHLFTNHMQKAIDIVNTII